MGERFSDCPLPLTPLCSVARQRCDVVLRDFFYCGSESTSTVLFIFVVFVHLAQEGVGVRGLTHRRY